MTKNTLTGLLCAAAFCAITSNAFALSSARIPDAGSSVALLGMAVAAIVGVRRFVGRSK